MARQSLTSVVPNHALVIERLALATEFYFFSASVANYAPLL